MKYLLAFLPLVYTTALFGAYNVKLAVYKNANNLHANIAKISNVKYRNAIKIEKKNNLYYAHATLASNQEAHHALHLYKKVFQDAFIAQKQVRLPQPKTVQPIVQKVKQAKKLPSFDAKALLADKTVYLCYENGPEHLRQRMVKMVFEEGHVIYSSLKEMSKPIKMPCEFKNNTLTLTLSQMQMTHHVTKQTSKYLVADSRVKGTTMHTLRYYFDEHAAMDFVTRR